MKETVLKIYYTVNGNLKQEEQGKFYYLEGKATFLADMTPAKWWYKFGGYSISKQILDAFSKAKIKPQIIYRLRTSGTLYYATSTLFQKKGILTASGGHSQYILPIKNFTAKKGNVAQEPKNLPVMSLSDWLKPPVTLIQDDFFGRWATQ
jgi:hypothetical protein